MATGTLTQPWDLQKVVDILYMLYGEENGLELTVSLSPKENDNQEDSGAV